MTADSLACATCGAPRVGPYCPDCGQRELRGRHTLRTLAADLLGRVLNLDTGLVHTAWRLTIAPDTVVRDYLAGRTAPYTHPAGYLLLTFAAFALVAGMLGGTGGSSDNRVFTALLIPFVALASRLIFWRTRLNYAEHLILAMYLLGHIALLLALLQALTPLIGERILPALAIAALLLAVGYFAWAYSRIFPSRRALAAAGSLLTLATGAALWMAALLALLNVLRQP